MHAMPISSTKTAVTSQSKQLAFSMRDDKTHQLGGRETVKQEYTLNAASSMPLGQATSERLATYLGDHFQKKEVARLSLGDRGTSEESFHSLLKWCKSPRLSQDEHTAQRVTVGTAFKRTEDN